jgi:hypothetical protein
MSNVNESNGAFWNCLYLNISYNIETQSSKYEFYLLGYSAVKSIEHNGVIS